MNDELLRLAERVEAASGPDRELDGAIAMLAFHPLKIVWGGNDRDATIIWENAASPLQFYTAFLDAAMTLVPEGFDWIIGRTNSGLTIHAEVGGRGDEFMRFGNTPALALCAAALRSRAQPK